MFYNLKKYLFNLITISLILASSNLYAQQEIKTEPIIVTANPLELPYNQLTHPITEISGDNLHKKLKPTIGETLSKEPGISSTYYAPGSSRPIIRGLDGDQVNIMQNGINNLDASANSVDHNVAIDPLAIEKIEVIRGPAALLYGSKAIGGVVNIIDNRIPEKPITEKVTGITDIKYNSVNNERSGSILLEGGINDYAWHINSFKRLTDNIKIPGFARSSNLREIEPIDEDEEKNEITNSQTNSDGMTIGVSKFFKKGNIGMSYTSYNSNYGIIGHEHHEEDGHDHEEEEEEEKIKIKMNQERYDFSGKYKDLTGSIKSIKYKLGISDYKHNEFEGNQLGTTYKNRGYDGRLEINHKKIGSFEGTIGFQSSKNDFSAIGEEAFIASSETNINSIFIFETVKIQDLIFQIGGRIDHQEIDVDKNFNNNFKNRNDTLTSASFGFVYNLDKKYSLAISSAYTQRAPNSQELYSYGEHLATETFEIGNQNLKTQKSTGLDISLRKNSDKSKSEINIFYNKFQDFITLTASGEEEDHLPIFNYINLPAEFYGIEAKTNFKAYDKNSHKVNIEFRGDYLEAKNRRSKEYLPRITPARIGFSTIYNYNKIGLNLDADYTFSQKNTAPNETKTDGYLMLNIGADYKINVGPTSSQLYFKATNLLDKEARNHISFLKDKLPYPGLSIMAGIKTAF